MFHVKEIRLTLIFCSYKEWQRQVLYETGNHFVERDGVVYIGNTPIRRYTFRSNWYFLGGDNVLNSHDSRYFGLVPEEYIVGIVSSAGKGSAKRRGLCHDCHRDSEK